MFCLPPAAGPRGSPRPAEQPTRAERRHALPQTAAVPEKKTCILVLHFVRKI